jgi:hypothetical protein
MSRARILCLLAVIALPACGGTDAEKSDEKAPPTKAPDGPPTPEENPRVADDGPLPDLDLSGEAPPGVAGVFFSVDGAMIPLGCWDPAAKKLVGGKACITLAKKGDSVLLSSEHGRALDVVGDPRNALCEVEERPSSLGTPALDAGQAYEWAAVPKALGAKAEQVSSKTKSDEATQLADDERAALQKAALALAPGATDGELRCTQKAELDIDGDGTKERFFGVLVGHPTSPDRSLLSALFMAPGGDLGRLRAIETSKRDLDVFTIRGAVDLEGDGRRELWVTLTFDGGSGDRLVHLDGEKAEPLAKWTCGA